MLQKHDMNLYVFINKVCENKARCTVKISDIYNTVIFGFIVNMATDLTCLKGIVHKKIKIIP